VDRHPLLEQIPQSVQAAPTPRPVEPGIRQQQTINRHQQLDQNPTRLLLTQALTNLQAHPVEPGVPPQQAEVLQLENPQPENLSPQAVNPNAGLLTFRALHPAPVKKPTVMPSVKEAISEKNPEVQWTTSQKGGDQLVVDDYILGLYSGPNVLKRGVVAVHFKCVNYTTRAGNCPYTLSSHDGVLRAGERPHNHASDPGDVVSRNARLHLKEAASTSETPMASIVSNTIAGAEAEYATSLGNNNALKQAGRRVRRIAAGGVGGAPLCIKELVLDPAMFQENPDSSESILLYDNGANGKEASVEGKRIIIFGKKSHLQYLTSSPVWLGDGTFDKSPKVNRQRFYQLWTLSALVLGRYFCLLRVCMQKKTMAAYAEVFQFISGYAQSQRWPITLFEKGGMLITDFEDAPGKALKTVAQKTYGSVNFSLRFCYFHFCHSVLKDVKKCGLWGLYCRKRCPTTWLHIMMIMQLPYCNPGDIPRYFELLREYLIAANSKTIPLLKRLEEYYIFGKNDKAPRFQAASWSVLERVLAGEPCTTNFLEAGHRMLDSVILCNHPRIEELGKKLWRLCRLDDKDIVDLFRGEQNVRRQKPEVGKFKPQIGELSGFELITYLSFPSGLKSLRG